jgi:hypothetical protein
MKNIIAIYHLGYFLDGNNEATFDESDDMICCKALDDYEQLLQSNNIQLSRDIIVPNYPLGPSNM